MEEGASTYQPNVDDIAWALRLVASVKDGGYWACSWGTYKVCKSEKRVKLMVLNPWFPRNKLKKLFHQTERTFEVLGYVADHEEGLRDVPESV